MKEYGPVHILWSASEEDLVDTLKGIANCIDQCCKATGKRMSGLSEAVLPVIHEYVLYSEMLMVRTLIVTILPESHPCSQAVYRQCMLLFSHCCLSVLTGSFATDAQ